jgi:Ca2+-binding EF-hand superfamily protein
MMRCFTWLLILLGSLLVFSVALHGDEYHESGLAFKFDLDHDGMITRAEFDKAIEAKMNNKLTWLDTNQDGVISPEEFRSQHRIEYDQRWSMWDSDNDGVVSVDAVLKQKQAVRKEVKKAMQKQE